MSGVLEIIGEIIGWVVAIIFIGWCLWRWLKKTHEPVMLIIRWLVTLTIIGLLSYASISFKKALAAQDKSAVFFVFQAAAAGIVLAIFWVPAITDYCGRLFGSIYDGGSEETDPKPFYSIFHAKKAKGLYLEALVEIRKQLDKFPTDFEGLIFLADLQAEHLNDLPGAAITIQRLCAQPEHSQRDISYALNRLADWHLDLTKDRDSAREVLSQIIVTMPGTDMALRAAQRIGHLANNETLLSADDRQKIEVKKGVKNLGLLRGDDGRLRAPVVDQEKLAAAYVEHLREHPLDTEAREKLAILYVKHYSRLDLATDQLEQMIQQPGHSSKKVIHWLNVLADLQVLAASEFEEVAATLQRIIDLYPDVAAAETARRRIGVLKLELKANHHRDAVRLGTYEQDIGLKSRTGN
jgi:hypothetical protein